MNEENQKSRGILDFLKDLLKNKVDGSEKKAEEIINKSLIDGKITENEADILKSVFLLESTRVDEIMVPRVDMIFLSVLADISEVIETYTINRYSKIPLYGDNFDDVVGILNIKDIVPFLNEFKKSETIFRSVDFASLPYFIPESKSVIETLRDLQKKHLSMALVVDEYGGICGMITLEDLLEEIVGEIQDSRTQEEEDFIEEQPGVILVNARMEISDFNKLYDLDIQSEDYHTVGGYILNNQEKIPVERDKFKIGKLKFEIVDATSQRILKIRIKETGK